MKNVRKGPRPKTAERIAAELRREIVTGNLQQGDKLHSERLLCEHFEVSRPTLREALRLLEAESLIRIARGPHGGAEVTALDIGVAARQVGLFLQMQGATLEDMWRVRALIEPAAAASVASLRDPQAIAELEESIKGAHEAMKDPLEYASYTAQFSEILTNYCQSKTLQLLIMLIRDIVRRQHQDITVKTYATKDSDRLMLLNIRGRERLMEFIKSGDADGAEKFWRSHLTGTASVVFSAYRAQMPIDVLGEVEPRESRKDAAEPAKEPSKEPRKARA